jgi:hypothetical protein
MGLRLLKFDTVHPPSYLHEKQAAARAQIRALSYAEYYQWLMNLRNNTSDSFTHYMNEAGWEAREFVTCDELFLDKLQQAGEFRFRAGDKLRTLVSHAASLSLGDVGRLQLRGDFARKARYARIRSYIETFRPDVLFLREPSHMDGRFFDQFRDKCLIVSLIACNTSYVWNWNTQRNDVIFTATAVYRDFFRAQNIRSEVIPFGVDERVVREIGDCPKAYDCTFVGNLGVGHQRGKTEFFNGLAQRVDFKWWGPWADGLNAYPALVRTRQGTASGLDMLQIYKQSRIVINEYPDFMKGEANNMRNAEVFTAGSLLLTRDAPGLAELVEAGALATYTDLDDCIAKIGFYLANETERERTARRGVEMALQRFNYRDIVGAMTQTIEEVLRDKRKKHG